MKHFYAAAALLFLLTAGTGMCMAQNYEVKGAGTPEVNGVYLASGKVNGKTSYVKGEFQLFYKGCEAKWMIKSKDGNYYRNMNDTPLPPQSGWEKGCAKGSKDPAPEITPVHNNQKPN